MQTVSSDGRIGRLESDSLEAGVRTEMAYYFETDGITVFIVGFSFRVIPFKRKVLQFIYGMAYSMYIAACGLDEEEEETMSDTSNNSNTSNRAQLDAKAFNPRPFTSEQSSLSKNGVAGRSSEDIGQRERLNSIDSASAPLSVWRTKSSVARSMDGMEHMEGDDGTSSPSTPGQRVRSRSSSAHNSAGSTEKTRAQIMAGSSPGPGVSAPLLMQQEQGASPASSTPSSGMMEGHVARSVASDGTHKSFQVLVDRSLAGSSARVNELVQEQAGTLAAAGTSPPYNSLRIEAMNRGEMVADEEDNRSDDAEGPQDYPPEEESGRSHHASQHNKMAIAVNSLNSLHSHHSSQGVAASAGTVGTDNSPHTYYGETPAAAASYEDTARGFQMDFQSQTAATGNAGGGPPPFTASAAASSAGSSHKDILIVQSTTMPHTWDPVDPFSYPVGNIPVKNWVPDNLEMEHFTEIQYIADGSNSNIFLARLNREKVVIKMIREDIQHDHVAVHEFDVEHGLLARVNHPNVIKLKGAGRHPRRFIILEWLGGGTLNSILSQHQVKSGLAQKLFRRPSFTYQNLLSRARDIAEALRYLHSHCHIGASIIHRDLKPDNVGFNSSGQLKLFDFGLCTCVKLRANVNDAYEMTGNTGSLRYMAPEIALKKPYNEKADVYSFSIMLWQMTKDKVPFKGMTRDDFMTNVGIRGERPKLDKSWPRAFSNMLVKSWDADHRMRPSFAELVDEIDSLLTTANWRYSHNRDDKKKSLSPPANSGDRHGNGNGNGNGNVEGKGDASGQLRRNKISDRNDLAAPHSEGMITSSSGNSNGDMSSTNSESAKAKEVERQSMWF